MRPPLLLPAPQYHECATCGINSLYVKDVDGSHYERPGLFFVEQRGSYSGDVLYELCDLCHAEWEEEHLRRHWEISTARGCPPGKEDVAFYGFEEMALVCVTDASGADWVADRERDRETWLFCRNRREWRVAWQIARTIRRYGRWPLDRAPISHFLPAYKAAGYDHLTIGINRLNRGAREAGPIIGCCDGCGEHDLLILAIDGSQWMNCEDCHHAAVARRAGEEAGI